MALSRGWRLFLLGRADGPLVGQVTRHSMDVVRVGYAGVCLGWAFGLLLAGTGLRDGGLSVAVLSLAFVAMVQAQRVGTGYEVEERGPALVLEVA